MNDKKVRRCGRIVSNGILLKKHERDIVAVFVGLGCSVELIPTARQRRMKTADAIIDGIEWEFKTPRGRTTRSIEHILKKAVSQSPNVVLDVRLMDLPGELVMRKIRYEAAHMRTLKRLKVILADGMVDIK